MGVRLRTAAIAAAVVACAGAGATAGVAEAHGGASAKPSKRIDGGTPKADRKVRAHRARRAGSRKPTARTAARTDNRTKPVIYVHGLDAFGTAGNNCSSTFGTMSNQLKNWGYSGTHATVKYYHGDTNCSTSLDTHGSHSKHYQRTDAHQNSSHDMDADIRHLGYHLAWMIYNQYSSKGITVDVVGHSMGGLITRYMLWGNQTNHADFPPYLYVEDVVTLGTPHGGSGYASWCGWAYECQQMATGSSFMNWMATNAKNPQGDGGTDWTAMGSYDDGYVSATSATKMDASHKVRYFNMGLGHSDYMNDTSDVRNADTEYNDNLGPWYLWYDSPHAVRWSDYALHLGSW